MPGYYNTQHLTDFGKIADVQPELGKKFFDYYKSVFADGALTAREKSLIALAVRTPCSVPIASMPTRRIVSKKGPTSSR